MIPVKQEGKFIDKEEELKAIVRRHIEADCKNAHQCCSTLEHLQERVRDRDVLIRCCDCRGLVPTFGVLGGSCGLFLRIIASFLDLVPKYQWADAVSAVRREFSELYDLFCRGVLPYLHTDTDALKHKGIGCGYLHNLWEAWGKYDFPCPHFVVELTRCYGGHCQEELRGERRELGLIKIRGQERLPMVTPRQDGIQFFVYHPQIEWFVLYHIGHRMLEQLNAIVKRETIEYSRFEKRVADMNDQHAVITTRKLAKGKPIFEVEIGHDLSIDRIAIQYV